MAPTSGNPGPATSIESRAYPPGALQDLEEPLSRTCPSALGQRRKADLRETHLSTQHPQASQDPRVPAPHVHPGRPRHPAGPPAQGTPPPHGVTVVSASGVERIREHSTFSALRRPAGRSSRGPLRVAFVRGAAGAAFASAQVGYAIPRRYGNAVARNRLRRRLRAVVAELGPSLEPGAYLLSCEAELSTLGPQALTDTVRDAMRTAAEVAAR
jgi:ribonuclease P protein component